MEGTQIKLTEKFRRKIRNKEEDNQSNHKYTFSQM